MTSTALTCNNIEIKTLKQVVLSQIVNYQPETYRILDKGGNITKEDPFFSDSQESNGYGI